MQLITRINIPIFKINANGILIFLLKIMVIDSVIRYMVVKRIVYITIGLNMIDATKSKLKREIIALVPTTCRTINS